MSKVAIITRTKNRELLLGRAIQSVLAQTFADFVHVVVNDAGNVAKVEELTGQYQEKYAGRLQLIHRESSTGMEAASNAAIKASQSDYVVIHDDDDSWEP